MTFPRKRKVGSPGDIDRGHTRFNNPTSNPRLLSENRQNRERQFPALVLKTRAEWIKGRKFTPVLVLEVAEERTNHSFFVMAGLVLA
jgi:hypothetical protein